MLAVKVHGSVGGRFFQGFASNLLAGPKNVAMFFVAWYLYDKPEAKMIKSYFLSKPASLSERNHRKLKWSLKMPPWRCKKWTKNDHHDPRCHGVGHWSLGISTFRSKWSTMWLWLGACGSICSAKGDVIRYWTDTLHSALLLFLEDANVQNPWVGVCLNLPLDFVSLICLRLFWFWIASQDYVDIFSCSSDSLLDLRVKTWSRKPIDMAASMKFFAKLGYFFHTLALLSLVRCYLRYLCFTKSSKL